jgi:hypothetical protein
MVLVSFFSQVPQVLNDAWQILIFVGGQRRDPHISRPVQELGDTSCFVLPSGREATSG